MSEMEVVFYETDWWKKPSPFTLTGAWQGEDEEYPGDYSAQPKNLTNTTTVVACSGEHCGATFETEELAKKIVYLCRRHTPKVKQTVFFQKYQFNRALG